MNELIGKLLHLKAPIKAGITGLPPGIASSAMPDINFGGLNPPISWAGNRSTITLRARSAKS